MPFIHAVARPRSTDTATATAVTAALTAVNVATVLTADFCCAVAYNFSATANPAQNPAVLPAKATATTPLIGTISVMSPIDRCDRARAPTDRTLLWFVPRRRPLQLDNPQRSQAETRGAALNAAPAATQRGVRG